MKRAFRVAQLYVGAYSVLFPFLILFVAKVSNN